MAKYFSKLAVFLGAMIQSNVAGLQLAGEESEVETPITKTMTLPEEEQKQIRNNIHALVTKWDDAEFRAKVIEQEGAKALPRPIRDLFVEFAGEDEELVARAQPPNAEAGVFAQYIKLTPDEQVACNNFFHGIDNESLMA